MQFDPLAGLEQERGAAYTLELGVAELNRAFCERVSEALAQGWRLYGSPTMTFDALNNEVKVGQAVVWHEVER